jgi:hypothetical protein
LKPIKHVIKTKDSSFRYHFTKGYFLAGSIISNLTHPVNEVNELRESLINSKKIIKRGSDLFLNSNYKIGLLMAYNLHCGKLENELENLSHDLNLYKSIPGLTDIFKGGVVSTENELFKNLYRKCVKFKSISSFALNYDFLKGAPPNEFSQSELFTAKLLHKHGFLTADFSHGNTELSESDIIDTNLNMQIEVTFAFKTELSNRRLSPFYNVELVLGEFSDNQFIRPSESLMKKMSNKYSPNLNPFLALLMIGTADSSLKLFERLLDKLESQGLQVSPFRGYFFIAYDPTKDHICILSTINKEIIYDEDCSDFTFVKKEPIDFSDMNEDEKYLVSLRDLFTNENQLLLMNKRDFLNYAKDIDLYF